MTAIINNFNDKVYIIKQSIFVETIKDGELESRWVTKVWQCGLYFSSDLNLKHVRITGKTKAQNILSFIIKYHKENRPLTEFKWISQFCCHGFELDRHSYLWEIVELNNDDSYY